MTANTPTFGWPYPVGTDRVRDGDNAIQALAEAIEATLNGYTPPVWGACYVPGGAAGMNATSWFGTCTTQGAGGGVTVTVNGITVPKRGYYLISATALLTFTQDVAATCTLFFGDGAAVWSKSAAEHIVAQDPTFPKAAACQLVVPLNAGTMVRWGVAATGTSAGIPNEGNANNSLAVRLLQIV
jgi:hypothetical protein